MTCDDTCVRFETHMSLEIDSLRFFFYITDRKEIKVTAIFFTAIFLTVITKKYLFRPVIPGHEVDEFRDAFYKLTLC